MYKITCPTCGAEYFPQEIFVLSELTNPHIVKDENGKILGNLNLDTHETYVCDYCDEAFTVDMNMDFSITKYKTLKPHSTKLKKTPLFLNEE